MVDTWPDIAARCSAAATSNLSEGLSMPNNPIHDETERSINDKQRWVA